MADHIGEGLGGFVVEATAALSILAYLAFLWLANPLGSGVESKRNYLFCAYWYLRRRRNNRIFSALPKGGPLSSVPAILAGGAAIMAVAGILFFREAPSWQRIVGITFAIIGLFLLRT